MPRHARASRFAALAVAGAVAAIVVAQFAGTTPAPSGGSAAPTATTPAGTAAASGVDPGDPAAVCEAFATALFNADTATDAGPGAAYRRAAGYATPHLAKSLAVAPARWLPDWEELVAHQGRVSAETSSYAGEPPPPGRAGTAHHAVIVTANATGAGGWDGPTRRHIVYCTLTAAGPRWQVASYDLEPQRLP